MVQTVSQRLLALLVDPRFHDETVDDDLTDAVTSLATDVEWQPVLDAMLDVLRDTSLVRHWYDVVACLLSLIHISEPTRPY